MVLVDAWTDGWVDELAVVLYDDEVVALGGGLLDGMMYRWVDCGGGGVTDKIGLRSQALISCYYPTYTFSFSVSIELL